MSVQSDKEELIAAISTVNRYGNFRVQRLWGTALIVIPLINILFVILFENTNLSTINAMLVFYIAHSVLLVLFIGFFFYSFFSTKKLKLKLSKIMVTYYAGLWIAFLIVLYFFAVNIMIAEYLGIFDTNSHNPLSLLFFGYAFPLESLIAPHYTFVYWGDNIGFLLSYFFLLISIKECKFKELLYGTILLFIFDLLAYVFDVFIFKTEVFGCNLWFVVPSIISVICGIYSIRRAYNTLNKQSNLNLSEMNVK